MVGISKTEVVDSMDLLPAGLAALGYGQPDGRFITTLADLREWLGEMAAAGEAALVDGLATRVQPPPRMDQPEGLVRRPTPRPHRPGLGGVHRPWRPLWCDGGWPGSCHEHELVTLSGLEEGLDASGVASLLDRGFRGMATRREHWHARSGTGAPGPAL
jgi:hypothetical protein